MKNLKIFAVIFTISFFLVAVPSNITTGCKDIVACGESTAGDYNLLLKVRDPSRSGIQVLCIVPEGYKYTYHHPWTGRPMVFETGHKYIGVTTKNDTIPNIIKSGMALNDAGLAFGDADTDSNWINPTMHAWDDFDWIRYACEAASNKNQAISLMTNDVVKKMHATGVSENLFIVGPNGGSVVEADAFNYNVKEINNGVVVMSNYPKALWRTQAHKKLPIASSFDIEKEKYVRKGGVISLNSLNMLKIVDVKENSIVVRQIPFFKIIDGRLLKRVKKVEIELGERKTVGDFSVKLLDINDNKAKVRLCYKFKAWEDEMMDHIQPKYGYISVKDMMNWSRLRREDLDGLRPMCEDAFKYEAAAIYKIPNENYKELSSGWFSPNHACTSIFVPFHICDNDIFDPYKTGEAAELSLKLLNICKDNTLTNSFSKTENVFLSETNTVEKIASELIANNQDISDFLTIIDMGMQRQAWETEQIWDEINNLDNQDKQEVTLIIDGLWKSNYSTSLESMEKTIHNLRNVSVSKTVIDKIGKIALSICKSEINASKSIGRENTTAEKEYRTGEELISQGEYESGFNHLQKAYKYNDMAMKGQPEMGLNGIKTELDEKINILPYVISVFLAITAVFILIKFRSK